MRKNEELMRRGKDIAERPAFLIQGPRKEAREKKPCQRHANTHRDNEGTRGFLGT